MDFFYLFIFRWSNIQVGLVPDQTSSRTKDPNVYFLSGDTRLNTLCIKSCSTQFLHLFSNSIMELCLLYISFGGFFVTKIYGNGLRRFLRRKIKVTKAQACNTIYKNKHSLNAPSINMRSWLYLGFTVVLDRVDLFQTLSLELVKGLSTDSMLEAGEN